MGKTHIYDAPNSIEILKNSIDSFVFDFYNIVDTPLDQLIHTSKGDIEKKIEEVNSLPEQEITTTVKIEGEEITYDEVIKSSEFFQIAQDISKNGVFSIISFTLSIFKNLGEHQAFEVIRLS